MIVLQTLREYFEDERKRYILVPVDWKEGGDQKEA